MLVEIKILFAPVSTIMLSRKYNNSICIMKNIREKIALSDKKYFELVVQNVGIFTPETASPWKYCE
jgi:hypothetical protein